MRCYYNIKVTYNAPRAKIDLLEITQFRLQFSSKHMRCTSINCKHEEFLVTHFKGKRLYVVYKNKVPHVAY